MMLPELSERERATIGPRELKTPGSPEWCWQTITHLRNVYQRVEERWRDVESMVTELEAARAWEVIPPGNPYGDEETMLRAELGIGLGEMQRTVGSARGRSVVAAQATDGETLPKGRQPENAVNAYSKHLQPERARASGVSRSQQQYLDAIAQRRPDLLEDIRAGRRSVRAAALEAGLRRPTATVPIDNAGAATAILSKHFTLHELARCWPAAAAATWRR